MNFEWIRQLTAAGIISLVATTSAGVLTGISEESVDGGIVIHVKGDSLGKPTIVKAYGGKAYILQFNAGLQGKAKTLSIGESGVTSARAGWYRSNPQIVRVLVKQESAYSPTLIKEAGGYALEFHTEHKAQAIKVIPKKATADDLPPVDVTVLKSPLRDHKVIASAKDEPKTTATEKASRVSLDFVNTDVVQILKALALQSGVNIIVSPDAGPAKLSVTMSNVTVKEALDYVTALARLRYAKVDQGYVVASDAMFGQIMTDLASHGGDHSLIRVVPITSGDGETIKKAIYHWFGPESLQVVLPNESSAKAAGQTAGGAAGAGLPGMPQTPAPTGGGAPAAGGPQAPAGPDSSNPYILLIGEKKWVDEAEALAKEVDDDIVAADRAHDDADRAKKKADLEAITQADQAKLQTGDEEQTMQTYVVENGKASDLAKEIAGVSELKTLEITATPTTSRRQAILLRGAPGIVDGAYQMLKQLDSAQVEGSKAVVYEVKYVDPRALREDLAVNFPGLTVTTPPPAAGNPALYQAGMVAGQENQAVAQGAPGTGGSTSGGSSSGGSSSGSGSSGGGSPSSSSGGQGNTGGLQLPYSSMEASAFPMRLVLQGSDAQIAQALAYVAKVDVAPHQIALELRVMELSREDAVKLGINWSVLTGGAVSAINLNQSQSGIGNNTSVANTITGAITGRGFSAGVTASLDAIANKNNLIARPNLLAIDGRESEVFVGDDIKYIQSVQSTQNGVSVTTGDVPVGVDLAVLPRVGGDGVITLDMRPTVSFLKSFTPVPGGGELPQTSLRTAQNTVMLHSGETIAIGGLIQDQDLMNVQKVPLLGDLPILGNLFRQTTHDRQRSEIVFFLTVKEITPENQETAADPRQSEKEHKAEIAIPKRSFK